MVVEFHMPEQAHFALQGVYYFFAVITCHEFNTYFRLMDVGWWPT